MNSHVVIKKKKKKNLRKFTFQEIRQEGNTTIYVGNAMSLGKDHFLLETCQMSA